MTMHYTKRREMWGLVTMYCNQSYRRPEVPDLPGIFPVYDSVFEQVSYTLNIHVLHNIVPAETENDELSNEQEEQIQKDAAELRHYHQAFRDAVTWVCSGEKIARQPEPSEIQAAMKLERLNWGRWPFVDQNSEKHLGFLETHGLKHLTVTVGAQFTVTGRPAGLILLPRAKHLIDLFCAFVLGECAFKSPAEMPVRVCQRPVCGNLFLPQGRWVQNFCSDDCRVRFHMPSGHESADARWIARLTDKNLPRGIRARRLRSQEARGRLAAIRERWQNSTLERQRRLASRAASLMEKAAAAEKKLDRSAASSAKG
jgi:hypothetical protein